MSRQGVFSSGGQVSSVQQTSGEPQSTRRRQTLPACQRLVEQVWYTLSLVVPTSNTREFLCPLPFHEGPDTIEAMALGHGHP